MCVCVCVWRGGSLGFQYDSEWEKGRWEAQVGGGEERGAYGMTFFSLSLSDLTARSGGIQMRG